MFHYTLESKWRYAVTPFSPIRLLFILGQCSFPMKYVLSLPRKKNNVLKYVKYILLINFLHLSSMQGKTMPIFSVVSILSCSLYSFTHPFEPLLARSFFIYPVCNVKRQKRGYWLENKARGKSNRSLRHRHCTPVMIYCAIQLIIKSVTVVGYKRDKGFSIATCDQLVKKSHHVKDLFFFFFLQKKVLHTSLFYMVYIFPEKAQHYILISQG